MMPQNRYFFSEKKLNAGNRYRLIKRKRELLEASNNGQESKQLEESAEEFAAPLPLEPDQQ